MGSYQNVIAKTGRERNCEVMLLIGILAAVIFTVLIGVAVFIHAKQIEKENKIVESYMAASERFIENVRGCIEATRHYRHDLSNYIQMLELLLEKEGQSVIVQEHLLGQKETYAKLSESKLCSDEFISAMIQMKMEECKEKEILFRAEVAEGDYSGMEEVDKVCLFMNLLDNAIEAAEKVQDKEKRTIHLKVEIIEKTLRIHMENSYIPDKSVAFFTTKADKENHGIGTAIITKIIRKYHGDRKTEWDESDGIFQDDVSCCLTGGAA